MQLEKWEALKEELTRKFKILEEKNEDLLVETGEGQVKQGTEEVLVFETPLGRVKLALEKRPLVLDKKFVFSHRAGQAARTEYTFSDTEYTYKLKAYKWSEDDDEWKEIDASAFAK
jgi:hypothetical protein